MIEEGQQTRTVHLNFKEYILNWIELYTFCKKSLVFLCKTTQRKKNKHKC